MSQANNLAQVTMSQNPFSPNYKAQIDLVDIVRQSNMSKVRSAQREARMQSEDAEQRKAAHGDIGALSKRPKGTRVTP